MVTAYGVTLSLRTRLIVGLVLVLMLVGAMYTAHTVYGIEFGRSRFLTYMIALDGRVQKKLSAAELAAVVESSNGLLATAKMLAAAAAAALIAVETWRSSRKTAWNKPDATWQTRARWFAALSLIFAALILGANYAACVWAAKTENPKLTGWLLWPNYVYLVDGLAAAVAFTLLRIPLWNISASGPEARELAALSRRELGEWIIGKGVVEREKDDLRQESDYRWQREVERCMRIAVEDYARGNPPCPNPAAHRAPPPATGAPSGKKLKKIDLDD